MPRPSGRNKAKVEAWTQQAFKVGSILRVCASSLDDRLATDLDALRSTIETAERITSDLMGEMMDFTDGKAGK